MVEIWQANTAGRYNHPSDDRSSQCLDEISQASGARAQMQAASSPLTVSQGPSRSRRSSGTARMVSVFARGLQASCDSRLLPDEEEANAVDPFSRPSKTGIFGEPL